MKSVTTNKADNDKKTNQHTMCKNCSQELKEGHAEKM